MTLCVTLLRQFAVNSHISPGSFNNSTHLIHPVISDALWTVTRCLHPTPTGNLPNLVSIQPAELCHERISLSLAQRTMESGHLFHSVLTRPASGNARHLKSRHPIVPSAQQLISLSVDNSRRVALWVDPRWNVEWLENTTRLCTFIPDIGTHTPGMALLRTACVQPNCLYNNVRFSAPACTNGVWPLFRLTWSRRDRWPCCPTMSNPLIPLHGLTALNAETFRFNVTFLPSRVCYENTRTCFSKHAENLTTYGYVLWCSQIVCIRHYHLNTIIAFYSVNEWMNFAVSVWLMACHATMLSHFT